MIVAAKLPVNPDARPAAPRCVFLAPSPVAPNEGCSADAAGDDPAEFPGAVLARRPHGFPPLHLGLRSVEHLVRDDSQSLIRALHTVFSLLMESAAVLVLRADLADVGGTPGVGGVAQHGPD